MVVPAPSEAGVAIQPGLDEIGEPLSSVTFVTVDLETTGGSPRTSAITEIGAVKTRGGEVIGEFQTLVDPGMPIPPMIVALTGITNAMVASAPRIEEVLPTFLEFAGGAVLVAHNAPFDMGFLKAACREHGYRWPGSEVVDTVTLARRCTTNEEAPNKKLSTLARVFGTEVTPNHRALDDARATSEIMHHMFERLAAWGITHREDLDALRNPVPPSIRRKAHLSDAVPARPGAYAFRGPNDEVLYVGTSKNLRARVKSYFTRGEQRRPIRDMLELAVRVESFPTATELEANVLEIRMIERHRPRYNRRSARPERTAWVRLTDEAFPRLSVVRSVSGESAHVGPMRGAGDARLAVEALHELGGVRTCTTRLPLAPRRGARACLLADLGSCSAPCLHGEASGYGDVAAALRDAIVGDPSPVVEALAARIAEFAGRLEFERASALRDGVSALVAGVAEAQRLAALRRVTLVAARRTGEEWEVAVAIRGRLAGTAAVGSGAAAAIAAACIIAEDEGGGAAGGDAAGGDAAGGGAVPLIEEQQLIAAWIEKPGTRLVSVDGEWAQPVAGAGRHGMWIEARREDRERVWDAYARTASGA
jgi:DNA polymerase-3 subunit epsilon